MKKTYLIVVTTLLFLTSAFAEDKATALPACENISKACESAGFNPGDHKKNGKGLWVDCVGAIAKGKTVAGVTATADEAKACLAAHKQMRKEKKKK